MVLTYILNKKFESIPMLAVAMEIILCHKQTLLYTKHRANICRNLIKCLFCFEVNLLSIGWNGYYCNKRKTEWSHRARMMANIFTLWAKKSEEERRSDWIAYVRADTFLCDLLDKLCLRKTKNVQEKFAQVANKWNHKYTQQMAKNTKK